MSVDETPNCGHSNQMVVIMYYFAMVLFTTLHKVVQTFQSEDEISMWSMVTLTFQNFANRIWSLVLIQFFAPKQTWHFKG